MAKKKKTYNSFLDKDEFIKWRLYPNTELDQYWSDFIKNNPDSEIELNEAIEKFRSVHLNKKSLPQNEIDDLLNRIVQTSSIKLKRKKRQQYYSWLSAACFLLLIAFTFFIQFERKIVLHVPSNTIVGETLPSEDIQLISGTKTVDIKQNAEILLTEEGEISIMEEGEGATEKAKINLAQSAINKLIVPYGKRSTLVLSDGTKVWLNSGSQLSFPTHFTGNERRITIDGEIFIEVAPNKEKPFYVHTPQFEIQVHGTKFNVSSYHDSEEKSVVLVEGKIEIKANGATKILNPGELFAWDSGRVRYGKVNVNEYISWKEGVFIFKQAPISEILKKIGRYYNVNFSNNESELLERTCTGKLYLSEDIVQVMNIMSVISNTSFKQSGNNIYISSTTK